MKTLVKIFGYLLLGFCGLIILTVIILKLISDDQYKAWLTAAAESATGRQFVIDGPFSLDFGREINLLAENLQVSNAEWGSREQMISSERLFVQIYPLSLLKGVLDLTLECDGTDVLLEKNNKGEGNWLFAASDKTLPETEAALAPQNADKQFILPLKPYIRNFRVRDFHFAFNAQDAEQALEAHVDIFRLFVNETKELPLVVKAVYQGAPLILEGTLGNIDDWHANRQTPVLVTGKLNEADLRLEGTAGPLIPRPTAGLNLFLTAPNVSTFTPFAGMELPELERLDVGLTARTADGHSSVENINLNIKDPQLAISVTGTIGDVSTMSGISLEADVNTDQGTALGRKLGDLPLNSLPNSLLLTAVFQGDLETLALTGFDLLMQDQGVDVKLSGTMANVMKLQGTDAELTAAIDNLDTIGGYIGQELPGFGPVDITATIRSPENNTKLESLLVNLNDPALSAQLSAATGTISLEELSKIRIEDIDARLKADSIQTEKIFEKLGLDLATALPASLSLEAETSGNLEKLGVNRLEIVAQDDGLGMTIKATMENILDLSGILATVTADAASTAALSKFAGMEVPDLGPLKVNSSIRSVDETYALDSFDLQLDGRDVQAHIEGSIKDVLALAQLEEASEKITETGIDMSFNADIASLSRLVSELSGIDVPELGTLQLSGQVGSAEQAPALESFNLTLNGEHLQAQVDATVQDLLALADLTEQSGKTGTAGIDVALAASTQSLSGLAAHAVGLEIPELGSLEVSATMQSLEEALQLRSFSAALMGEGVEAHIEGSIADIAALSDIKATARATISSLQKLAPVTQSALPETGPWSLDARLSSENLNSPLIFNGTLEGEGTTTVVDATIPHIRAPQTLLAKLNVDAESLAFLEHFMDRELPEDRPVKVSTRLAATPGEYRLEDFLVLFGDGQLRSDLTYTAAPGDKARRKNLTGEISIQDIDITPFYTFDTAAEEETGGTVEEAVSAEETQGQEQTAGGKKLFPSTPLKVGPLQEYDLDLKLEVADLVIRENFSITGNTAVSLDRGLLAVDPFTLVGNDNATADGRFTLDARSSPAKLDLFLDFNDFVSPRIGGKFNLDAELEGEGESIATLMASLDGRFVAKLNDGELKRTVLSQYGAGLLKQLNPLDNEQTTLECAIARFDFTDGMMEFENKIAAQTTEVTWIGGGTINLKTEEIDFGIAPKARNILSSMTNIDLASLVHVGGTLAEPSFGFDLADAGQKYAEYTAFIATGGLSFLAKKAYDNRVSNIDQCERILADLKEK